MKQNTAKGLALLLFIAIAAWGMSSCKSDAETAAETSVQSSRAVAQIPETPEFNSGVPEWVLNPPASTDELLYGIGLANQSNQQMAITMAESRARQSIAVQIETVVQAAIEDYMQQSGSTGSADAIEFAEVVSRQIVNVKLAGATVVQRAKGDDGTWYVLVSCPKTDAAADAASVVVSEASQYAEFKNWQAQQDLDKYLQQYTGAPTPSGE